MVVNMQGRSFMGIEMQESGFLIYPGENMAVKRVGGLGPLRETIINTTYTVQASIE